MPQSSRLKSANAPSPRHFYFFRRRPWRKGRARAHGLADHHYNLSEVLLHLQNHDLRSHYHFTPKLKALDPHYLTLHLTVHNTFTFTAPDFQHLRFLRNHLRSTDNEYQSSLLNMSNAYDPYHHDLTSRTNSLQNDPA